MYVYYSSVPNDRVVNIPASWLGLKEFVDCDIYAKLRALFEGVFDIRKGSELTPAEDRAWLELQQWVSSNQRALFAHRNNSVTGCTDFASFNSNDSEVPSQVFFMSNFNTGEQVVFMIIGEPSYNDGGTPGDLIGCNRHMRDFYSDY